MMVQQEKLDLNGYDDRPLPHTFFKQETDTDHLALILPGRDYTAHMPLLFYPTLTLLNRGVDVLRLDVHYLKRDEFQALEMNQQLRYLFAEVETAYQMGMAQGDYQQVTLVGKSLGTLAMGHLLTTASLPARVNAIWLTPLVRFDFLREQIKTFAGHSLFVIGTADPHYDAQRLAEVQQATQGEVVIIEDADHGMNIAGDLSGSIKALDKIVQAVDAFLA